MAGAEGRTVGLRSWQLIALGTLAQSGVGLWLFNSGGTAGSSAASGLVLLFLGGGVVVLAVGVGLVTLLVTGLLSHWNFEGIAAAFTLLVGALFLVAGSISPVFLVLPAFFFGAAVLSWRERGA